MSLQSEFLADSPLFYWTCNTTAGAEANTGSAGVNALTPTSLSAQNAAGLFSGSGTSWQYNGTSSFARTAAGGLLAPIAIPVITVAFVMSWDAFANDDKLAMELTDNFNVDVGGFIVDPNEASTGRFMFGFGNAGAGTWIDGFTRPSAVAAHIYHLVMNMTTPVNKAYVDGGAQSLTAQVHTGSFGNFRSDRPLNLMSRAGSLLFGAGKLQHVAIFGGELSSGRVAAQAAAAFPPSGGHSDGMLLGVMCKAWQPLRSWRKRGSGLVVPELGWA